jgi:hypothetical protein
MPARAPADGRFNAVDLHPRWLRLTPLKVIERLATLILGSRLNNRIRSGSRALLALARPNPAPRE